MSHPLEASYFMSSTNKYPAKYRRSNFHSQIGPMADFGIFIASLVLSIAIYCGQSRRSGLLLLAPLALPSPLIYLFLLLPLSSYRRCSTILPQYEACCGSPIQTVIIISLRLLLTKHVVSNKMTAQKYELYHHEEKHPMINFGRKRTMTWVLSVTQGMIPSSRDLEISTVEKINDNMGRRDKYATTIEEINLLYE